MSEAILTHEQKVEKLLGAIVASNGLILACLLPNLPRSNQHSIEEAMDDLSGAVSGILDENAGS